VPDPWNDSELVRRFTAQAATATPRAPLNAALCRVIARHRSLSGLLAHAPITQQLPVLLLAAIHFLVIEEPGSALAAWYPNLTDAHRDPKDDALDPVLRAFAEDRGPSLLELVASRRVQTNEVGRCALFLPIFAMIANEVGPIAHIDVGTSAGLNTLTGHYSYRYDDCEPIGPVSAVEITCSTRGAGPIPSALPSIAAAVGIDSNPIDLADPIEARWLEACCWPDQADRFKRLRAAIDIARRHPPDIRVGDAVDTLAETVDEVAVTPRTVTPRAVTPRAVTPRAVTPRTVTPRTVTPGHPVVTTSWVMNYLTAPRRTTFVAELDRLGATRDISWVIAESPAVTPELPYAAESGTEHTTALTLVTWRSGTRRTVDLGTCHPHGYWIHWR
jgi:hypothetical protein